MSEKTPTGNYWLSGDFGSRAASNSTSGCLDCGAVVWNETTHNYWHARQDAPSPAAASPLCSCGARAVEDGGTEGVCECCTDCERGEPLTDEERRRLLTPPEVTP